MHLLRLIDEHPWLVPLTRSVAELAWKFWKSRNQKTKKEETTALAVESSINQTKH